MASDAYQSLGVDHDIEVGVPVQAGLLGAVVGRVGNGLTASRGSEETWLIVRDRLRLAPVNDVFPWRRGTGFPIRRVFWHGGEAWWRTPLGPPIPVVSWVAYSSAAKQPWLGEVWPGSAVR